MPRPQFSLKTLLLAMSLAGVAAYLAKEAYHAIPLSGWRIVLPFGCSACAGASIGAVATSRLRGIILGFAAGAVALSVALLLWCVIACLLDDAPGLAALYLAASVGWVALWSAVFRAASRKESKARA